jgi:hypothetical protein
METADRIQAFEWFPRDMVTEMFLHLYLCLGCCCHLMIFSYHAAYHNLLHNLNNSNVVSSNSQFALAVGDASGGAKEGGSHPT